MKHQSLRQAQTRTPLTTCPILGDKSVDSLSFPANHITLMMQETGPACFFLPICLDTAKYISMKLLLSVAAASKKKKQGKKYNFTRLRKNYV